MILTTEGNKGSGMSGFPMNMTEQEKKKMKYFLWIRDSLGIIPPEATYEEFLQSEYNKGEEYEN